MDSSGARQKYAMFCGILKCLSVFDAVKQDMYFVSLRKTWDKTNYYDVI